MHYTALPDERGNFVQNLDGFWIVYRVPTETARFYRERTIGLGVTVKNNVSRRLIKITQITLITPPRGISRHITVVKSHALSFGAINDT